MNPRRTLGGPQTDPRRTQADIRHKYWHCLRPGLVSANPHLYGALLTDPRRTLSGLQIFICLTSTLSWRTQTDPRRTLSGPQIFINFVWQALYRYLDGPRRTLSGPCLDLRSSFVWQALCLDGPLADPDGASLNLHLFESTVWQRLQTDLSRTQTDPRGPWLSL